MTGLTMNIDEIADRYDMLINNNDCVKENVLQKLKKTGGYCPCFPQHTEDTICPCKYMRTLHVCRCGLYIPKKENK